MNYNNSSGQCITTYCEYAIAQDGSHCNKKCPNNSYQHYANKSNGDCITTKYCPNKFTYNDINCYQTCPEYGINTPNGDCSCPLGTPKNKNKCNEPCTNTEHAIKVNSSLNGKCVIVQQCIYGLDANGDACNQFCKNNSIHTASGGCLSCKYGANNNNECNTCPYGIAENSDYCNKECVNTTYKHYTNTYSGNCSMTKSCPNGFNVDGNCIIITCPKYGEVGKDGECYCPYGNAQNAGYCNEECENSNYAIFSNSSNGKCIFIRGCPSGVNYAGTKCRKDF